MCLKSKIKIRVDLKISKRKERIDNNLQQGQINIQFVKITAEGLYSNLFRNLSYNF
jgi:hypothetical protein